MLTAVVQMEELVAAMTRGRIDLVTNNRTYSGTRSNWGAMRDDGNRVSATVTAIADMAAGHTATVTVRNDAGDVVATYPVEVDQGMNSIAWDGLAAESGGRHSFTSWYWILLEPTENKAVLYGAPPAAGLLAGVLFLIVARRQRKRFQE